MPATKKSDKANNKAILLKSADCAFMLYVHGFLSQREYEKVKQRLTKFRNTHFAKALPKS